MKQLLQLEMLGRLLAKAAAQCCTVDVYFARSFWKSLLHQPLGLADLESMDPELHRSLEWVLANPIDELGLTFVASAVDQTEVELRPGGAREAVTDASKAAFVELKAQWVMEGQLRAQVHALRRGFEVVLPGLGLDGAALSAHALELLVCGLPFIDTDDWRCNTDYIGCFKEQGAAHPTVIQFWAVVSGWPLDLQAGLLRFATGTPKVPAGGFDALCGSDGRRHFTLEGYTGWAMDTLPKAHTCFNTLCLPARGEYASAEELRGKLETAVRETECGGFDLV